MHASPFHDSDIDIKIKSNKHGIRWKDSSFNFSCMTIWKIIFEAAARSYFISLQILVQLASCCITMKPNLLFEGKGGQSNA